MSPRPYTDNDYELVASWWKARFFPPLDPRVLSSIGFIVENHAVGFLYTTNSAVAWMEWITTNPASDKIERDKALNLLIETILTKAKSLGALAVFTSVEDTGLIERYGRHGFVITDKNATNMVRGI